MAFLLLLLLVAAPGLSAQTDSTAPPRPVVVDTEPPPPVPREFRGVWVATVSNIDWPSKPGLPVPEQQAELLEILDRAAELHLNAVIFQVRPAADALYESKIEPWSAFLTGTMGRAPEPFWDPLRFAIDEAHKRGLELHAWFNPYRAGHPDDRSKPSPKHIRVRRPDLVRKYGPYYWLDPGSAEVRAYTRRVVLDVVQRYDVDGVHIDDYFYPYPERARRREIPFPDNATWRAYRRSGGRLSRDDWRRRNVDLLVEDLYKSIKAAKPWVKFGISPFGIWRPGSPESVSGFDAYDRLYADSKRWLERGWVDYFTPQLYWRLDAPQQRYTELLRWWSEQNPMGRHLWPGNYADRVGASGSVSWRASELLEQIRATREDSGASGNVHFSMRVFLENRDSLVTRLEVGPYATPALVPSSPWLAGSGTNGGAVPPVAPRVETQADSISGRLALSFTPGSSSPVRLWVVQARFGTDWVTTLVPGTERRYVIAPAEAGARPTTVVVAAVDRLGMESPPVRLSLVESDSAGTPGREAKPQKPR